MILSTTESIPGKEIVEYKGLVAGNTVQAKHIGRDILAGLKNLVGGEIHEYSDLLKQSRDRAVERMIRQAEELGANAIVSIRMQTSNVMDMASEILVYGTAVVVT